MMFVAQGPYHQMSCPGWAKKNKNPESNKFSMRENIVLVYFRQFPQQTPEFQSESHRILVIQKTLPP